MRTATLLLAVGALFTGAAWNTAAVCDAMVVIYQSGTVRQCLAVGGFIVGIGSCIVALVVMARQPGRIIDADGDIWNHGRNE